MENYEKPVVEEYGTLAELTLASLTGNQTDVVLGTPTAGFHIQTCVPGGGTCVTLP